MQETSKLVSMRTKQSGTANSNEQTNHKVRILQLNTPTNYVYVQYFDTCSN